MITEKKTYQEQIAAIESNEFAVYLDRLSKQVGLPVKSLMALALYNSSLGAGFREDSRATAAGQRKLARYLSAPQNEKPAAATPAPAAKASPPVEATTVVRWVLIRASRTLVIESYPVTLIAGRPVSSDQLHRAFNQKVVTGFLQPPYTVGIRMKEPFEQLLKSEPNALRGQFEISAVGIDVSFSPDSVKQDASSEAAAKSDLVQLYPWVLDFDSWMVSVGDREDSDMPQFFGLPGMLEAFRKDPRMAGQQFNGMKYYPHKDFITRVRPGTRGTAGEFVVRGGVVESSRVTQPGLDRQGVPPEAEDWLLLAPTNHLVIQARRPSDVLAYWNGDLIARVHTFNASPHCRLPVTKAEYRSPQEFQQLLSSGTQPTGQFYWGDGVLKVRVNAPEVPESAKKPTPPTGFYGRAVVFGDNTSQLVYTCAHTSSVPGNDTADSEADREKLNSLLLSAVNRMGLGFGVASGMIVAEHGFRHLIANQVPVWSTHYTLDVNAGIDSVVFS